MKIFVIIQIFLKVDGIFSEPEFPPPLKLTKIKLK